MVHPGGSRRETYPLRKTRLVELIREGRVGEVIQIEADFSFQTAYDPASLLFARELGGGAILDVGCYCMSMTRLLAGAAVNEPFANPTRILALGKIDPGEQIDLFSSAMLEFPSGIVGNLTTGLIVRKNNQVKVYGSQGILTVTSPWFAGGVGASLIFEKPGSPEREEISTEDPANLYGYEIDLVARYCEVGEAPAMTLADTMGNMTALDNWREQVGVKYPADRDGRD